MRRNRGVRWALAGRILPLEASTIFEMLERGNTSTLDFVGLDDGISLQCGAAPI